MTYHALNRTQRKIICPFHSSKAFAVRVYSAAAESERTEQNSSERRAPCAEIILARPPALASKAINARKYVTLSPVTIRSLAMLDRQDRGRRACALPPPFRQGPGVRPPHGRAGATFCPDGDDLRGLSERWTERPNATFCPDGIGYSTCGRFCRFESLADLASRPKEDTVGYGVRERFEL